MKIAINGNIIDTQDIYMITDVELINKSQNNFLFVFLIKLWNDKEIKIQKKSEQFDPLIEFRGAKNNEQLKEMVKSHPIYVNCNNEISNFRNKIIDIWKENQFSIPQYNLSE